MDRVIHLMNNFCLPGRRSVGNQFTECGMAYCVCGGWGEGVRYCGSSADRLFGDFFVLSCVKARVVKRSAGFFFSPRNVLPERQYERVTDFRQRLIVSQLWLCPVRPCGAIPPGLTAGPLPFTSHGRLRRPEPRLRHGQEHGLRS